MKKVLSILLSFVIIISSFCFAGNAFAQNELSNAEITVTYYQTNARSMLTSINNFRTGSDAWYWDKNDQDKVTCTGLTELVYDYDLEKIAMQRAAEIAVSFSHTRPNGEIFYTAYDSYNSCGENIAMGCTSASSAFEAWKENAEKYSGQGHRRNMLSSKFTAVAVACVKYNGTYYWVQEFRNPVVSTAATPANDSATKVNIETSSPEDIHIHTYKTTTTKATTSKDGTVVTKCSVCGDVKSKSTICYPKTIALSATSYTYNGKERKPGVTVTDSNGNEISESNYTVTYSSGRKNVGTYTVTIKFKGNYSGTVKKTFTIKPKATSISKVTAGKKKFTVKWKKLTTQTTGYQIQYSTSSKFSNAKTVTVSKNKTASKTISKLKANKKYYVRVRAYKTVSVNGVYAKIYSSWSKAKSVTTKNKI